MVVIVIENTINNLILCAVKIEVMSFQQNIFLKNQTLSTKTTKHSVCTNSKNA